MFDNLNIDDRCKNELIQAINNKKLSHAVILEGADEVTRHLASKELAKAILCKGERTKPCDACSSCIKANADSHPDIHFLKKDSGAGSIKVDEIRQLKAQAALLPNDGDKCVFIINEAQDMGIAAQNALLKIFEEPADHVSFILTCQSKSSFLDTIISRGSLYSLSADDLSGADDEKTAAAKEKSAELLNILCDKTEFDFLCCTAAFQKDKELLSSTLEQITVVFRDALVNTESEKDCLSGQYVLSKKLSMNFSQAKLIEYIAKTRDFASKLNASANHNLLLTRLCSTFYNIKMK